MESKKTIFEYDNYRAFLKDAYLALKARDGKFSYRFFSRIAGFKSPNILKLVIDGDRNIAPESIEKFSGAFKLNKEEALFFHNLVLLNQASTADDKSYYARELLKSRSYRKIHPLKEGQYHFFSVWYYVLIREMVGLTHFKEDYEWMAQQIQPAITAAEAKKAVDELTQLGLLERDNENRLRQSQNNIGTPDEVTASSITKCLREFMNRASESIDTVPREKRDISAVTFVTSEETVKRIKEKIQKFRKEILEMAAESLTPDNVYQLNFQFFPLTSEEEEGEAS
jgi:uncharacterized protein (TIGR02147 family)